MGKLIDLTGQKFGRLTVIERAASIDRKANWLCSCECGNTTITQGYYLRKGHTKSCGCLRSEVGKSNRTHGKSYSKLYFVWNTMRNRCRNEKTQKYRDYGLRGIQVCDVWRDNFQAFYDWAMLHGYQSGLTIERIDVNGNYEPSNCKWIPQKEQARNKRNNYNITFNGETKCLATWAEEYDLSQRTLWVRLNRLGWSTEKALTTPVRGTIL